MPDQATTSILDGTELYNTSGPSPGQPAISDIHQAGFGDCRTLAALGALVQNDPEAVKNMIHENGDGSYTVDLYQDDSGTPKPVNVTADDITTNAANMSADDPVIDANNGKHIIWPTIVEAAFEKVNTGSLYAFTGDTRQSPPVITDEMAELKSQFQSGNIITLGAIAPPGIPISLAAGDYNLVSPHEYTLTGVYTADNGEEFVSLNNPWGTSQPKDIPLNEIPNYFDTIEVDSYKSTNSTNTDNVGANIFDIANPPTDITGTSGNDYLYGEATILGGPGDDTIVGYGDAATAKYLGDRADYDITYNQHDKTFTVIDQGSGFSEGTDTDSGITYFEFADGRFSATEFMTNATPVKTIDSTGSTGLVECGNKYYIISSDGAPDLALQYRSGYDVVDAAYSGMAPIAAEQTGTGYDVAWKVNGMDQYDIWAVDSSGKYINSLLENVSGSDPTFEEYEAIFGQDLNGDKITGPDGQLTNNTTATSTTIVSAGSTNLVQTGDNYYLNPVDGGTGPELKYNGVAVIADDSLSPIAVGKTDTGYDVAWKNNVTDQYNIWTTDSFGNYTGSLTGGYVAGDTQNFGAQYETIFGKDLNGDNITRIDPALSEQNTIESDGATSLAQIGHNFYLNPSDGSSDGPELKILGGAPVTDATGIPIAAEQTATGYEVAWKDPESGQYEIWTTDGDGNYTGTQFCSDEVDYEKAFAQNSIGAGVTGPSSAASTPAATAPATEPVTTPTSPPDPLTQSSSQPADTSAGPPAQPSATQESASTQPDLNSVTGTTNGANGLSNSSIDSAHASTSDGSVAPVSNSTNDALNTPFAAASGDGAPGSSATDTSASPSAQPTEAQQTVSSQLDGNSITGTANGGNSQSENSVDTTHPSASDSSAVPVSNSTNDTLSGAVAGASGNGGAGSSATGSDTTNVQQGDPPTATSSASTDSSSDLEQHLLAALQHYYSLSTNGSGSDGQAASNVPDSASNLDNASADVSGGYASTADDASHVSSLNLFDTHSTADLRL